MSDEQIKNISIEKFPDYTDPELVKYNWEQQQTRKIWAEGFKAGIEFNKTSNTPAPVTTENENINQFSL